MYEQKINKMLLDINNKLNIHSSSKQGYMYLSLESGIYNIMKRNFMPGGGETLKSFGTADDTINYLEKQLGRLC